MWYVYFYKDPEDDSVFYVGKGKGNRHKTHLYRASTWVNQGKPTSCGSLNLHLIRKIVKIREHGNEPIIELIAYFDKEQDAYDREVLEILNRKSTLCNLTEGGEGFRVNEEKRKLMSENRKAWCESEAGLSWRKMMSESRKGTGNPAFGKKEDEHHKQDRMKNMLAKERWNKGLRGDSRSKGPLKGSLSHNSKKCRAINVVTNEIIEEKSLSRLAIKMKQSGHILSLSSINRVLAQKKPIKNWFVELDYDQS